ncbi:MAG: hypothetical protein AAF196_15185 [Planctomycetota bacterium]
MLRPALVRIVPLLALLTGTALGQTTAPRQPGQFTTGFNVGFAEWPNVMFFFDLNVLNPNGITLRSLNLSLSQGRNQSVPVEMEIYVVSGPNATAFGNESIQPGMPFATDPSLSWPTSPTARSSFISVSGQTTHDTDAPAVFEHGIYLPPGPNAFALWVPEHRFSITNQPRPTVGNADLEVIGGTRVGGRFGSGNPTARTDAHQNLTFDYFGGNVQFATTERVGESCPEINDPYFLFEQFDAGAADLTGSSLTFFPTGTGYVVTLGPDQTIGGTGAMTLPRLRHGVGGITIPITLPFTFNALGVSTNQIQVEMHGAVRLGVGNPPSLSGPALTTAPGGMFSGSPILSAGGRFYPPLSDPFQNLPTFDVINGEAVITWDSVTANRDSPSVQDSVQIVLRPDGSFTFNYADLDAPNETLVGISSGTSALARTFPILIEPTDLSRLTTPLETGSRQISPCLLGQDRPVLGSTFHMLTQGIRPGITSTGAMIGGFSSPALNLDSVGLPGCTLRSSGDFSLPILVGASSAMTSIAIPDLPGLEGASLFLQSILVEPAPSSSGVEILLSNGLRADLEAF